MTSVATNLPLCSRFKYYNAIISLRKALENALEGKDTSCVNRIRAVILPQLKVLADLKNQEMKLAVITYVTQDGQAPDTTELNKKVNEFNRSYTAFVVSCHAIDPEKIYINPEDIDPSKFA